MKPVKFLAQAAAEMNAAAAYYEREQADLGKRYLAAVQEVIRKIQINPALYPVVAPGVRRCLAKTFPFGVLYRDQPNLIEVVAVMHLRRDPNYWQNR